jgi:hypothetical protein
MAKEGVPVVLKTPPWTDEVLDERVQRGSHKSCDEHLEFLREEMLEFVQKGFWLMLPYRVVKRLFKQLRVSPMGVVPQRERRPRLIADYSYYDVNDDTVKLAPAEAMQFGRALERILYHIRHANPRYGPVRLGKIDLADGFYRVGLNSSSIPKLGIAFPRYDGEEQMIALPLVLPMGWVSSPPYLCAATETVADVANNMPSHLDAPPHPLEELANSLPEDEKVESPGNNIGEPGGPKAAPALTGRSSRVEPKVGQTPGVSDSAMPPAFRTYHKPVAFNDIYIDDYVQGIQAPRAKRMQHQRRLLHSIDSVFRPVDDNDDPVRKDVPSRKKLSKGDATLLTRKNVLGWIIDTLRGTIELPEHRRLRLEEIFDYLRGRRRVGVSKWRKILGELRSMAIGIPGSKGLFGALQTGLKYADHDRIVITLSIRDQLSDFEYIAADLCKRPTYIAELVPDHPIAVGPHDASGEGMGGVWLPAVENSGLEPILWRARFPAKISNRLVSFKNPHGDITNSDLELAGLVGHEDVLVQELDCRGRTVVPLSDNTPTVSWTLKGSTTTTGPAGYLLRLHSLHQRHFQYLSKPDYISGPANVMADDCSRLWHLTDSQLLAYFNSKYPQRVPWRIVTLQPEMHSSLISALQRQRAEPASHLNDPLRKTVTSASGQPSLKPIRSTPTYETSKTSFLFSKYSPRDYGAAKLHPAATLSELTQWKTTYLPSARRSPSWGPKSTPGMTRYVSDTKN